MLKLTCEPIALIAVFVLALAFTASVEANATLVLGAVAGAIYLALLVRRGLRAQMRSKRTAGERP